MNASDVKWLLHVTPIEVPGSSISHWPFIKWSFESLAVSGFHFVSKPPSFLVFHLKS